ncbi:MAG: M48 family metallopeptidase [Gemmatimonadetes bacterium]|nr:M48 family metallopeptidase [Gemmatimonadota bacterium]
MSDSNLFEQQRINRRRSILLIAGFLMFFAWIGFGGDAAFYLYTSDLPPREYHHVIPIFGIVATLLAIGMVWYGWRTGPKQVLWAAGAWELVNPGKPQERVLVNVIEEMCIASGLRRPTIWIVPDKDPNALATGIDEAHAHVAVTEGLLESLDRDELQAVVAHELAHVRNHDVRLMTLLAALVGVIALISDGTARFIGRGGARGVRLGRSGGGGGKKGGQLAAIVFVIWLISLLLAPIISRLLALAVSRKREYLADASAAQFTRNPLALASALRKIEDAAAPTASIHRGSAHLCIADPLGRRVSSKEGFLADVFGTHPPMAVRIARLKQMAYEYEKTGAIPETV